MHIRDIVALHASQPDVYAHFVKGEFTVLKTGRAFSAIAIDQAREQNNDAVKGDSGAVSLTEIPAALQRWMVSGLELLRNLQHLVMPE